MNLPDTLTVRTGGGGRHLFFRHRGPALPNSAGRLAGLGEPPGVDLRGDGGYVVAPPVSPCLRAALPVGRQQSSSQRRLCRAGRSIDRHRPPLSDQREVQRGRQTRYAQAALEGEVRAVQAGAGSDPQRHPEPGRLQTGHPRRSRPARRGHRVDDAGRCGRSGRAGRPGGERIAPLRTDRGGRQPTPAQDRVPAPIAAPAGSPARAPRAGRCQTDPTARALNGPTLSAFPEPVLDLLGQITPAVRPQARRQSIPVRLGPP